EVVQRYGNGVPYHPSSPRFGRGDARSLSEGDCHYWGVWHDGQPFEVFLDRTGRFMSEFGFQSFPDPATIASFAPEDETDEDSPSISCHQKHPRGNSLIREYMARDFPEPADFDDLVYLSQLLQARGVSMGIEAQRRAAPFCMGSLYWQLNDCWPAVSWSSIDYTGRRKALYYEAKRAFAPVLISPVVEDGRFRVYLIDDRSISEADDRIDGELIIETIGLEGLPRTETRVTGLVPSTIGPCFETDLEAVCLPSGVGSTLIRLTLTTGEKTSPVRLPPPRPIPPRTIAERLFFPAAPKEMALPDPGLTVTVREAKDGYAILLESGNLARGVYLSFGETAGVFSDNWFDMAPGTGKTVSFVTRSRIEDPSSCLRVRTLYDTLR
ncbi:MAG TPA: glycoside hydrolase family 2 protein, partial [Candidatus Krumholzibacterium sp.]|nr:glycoside hydrolase family 2 protein [Candidatus Krumholzibacterium sp.]